MEAPLLVAALLLLSSTLVVSEFCVCRSEQPQAALQKTIDYACGAGADCNSIHEQGPCYNPNNVVAHCSWAANSYFQKKRAMGATCDFGGTALVVSTDPRSAEQGNSCSLIFNYSSGWSGEELWSQSDSEQGLNCSSGCSYPSSASAAGTSTTPTGAGTGIGGTTGGTPGTFTPGAGTSTGGMGGTGTGTDTTTGFGGLGPTGTSNMDTAAAGLHPRSGAPAFLALLLSFLAFA